MKHNDLNEETLTNACNSIMAFLCTQIVDFSDDEFKGITKSETGINGLLESLYRAKLLGIDGKVLEGELLPFDFVNLNVAKQLLAINIGDEENPIELIQDALSGRVKLCLNDDIPMADIYSMQFEFGLFRELQGPDLYLSELAALANMSERSVRNDLLSAPEGVVYKVAGDTTRIKVSFAKEWLKSRKEFKPTNNLAWPAEETGEFIQVPAASDGTFFSPACAYKRGGFTVGNKGDEIKIDTYEEALEYLKSMSLAKWRRPNKSGNYGIVSAVSWQRISVSELHEISPKHGK
jgi:hypothetical protein